MKKIKELKDVIILSSNQKLDVLGGLIECDGIVPYSARGCQITTLGVSPKPPTTTEPFPKPGPSCTCPCDCLEDGGSFFAVGMVYSKLR